MPKSDFVAGNLLRIKPADDDDVVAISMCGAIVRFVRFTASGHASVTNGEGPSTRNSVKLIFRPQDLEKI